MLRYILLVFFIQKIKNITVSNEINSHYEGHMFPSKYLETDPELPTAMDLDHYLKQLSISIKYFARNPNSTDSNTALCLFFTKSILKKTLFDSGDKLEPCLVNRLAKSINDVEYTLSHYIYKNAFYDWKYIEFRVSKLFQYDSGLKYSLGKFNRNRLKHWIMDTEHVNDFIQDMDAGTLAKEKYAKLAESKYDGFYNIKIQDSDVCISQIAYNPEPIDVRLVRPCKLDEYCYHRLNSGPSIAYTLSHRLLNMILRVSARRCYLNSEAEDLQRADQLCASMYREVVYLARRGYFARDLFLEHIALCGVMGYEEFHRKRWFYKAASWMNSYGCMKEFLNFELNRTRVLLARAGEAGRRYLLTWRCQTTYSPCDDHPTALLMVVLSHAVRHAAHFMLPL